MLSGAEKGLEFALLVSEQAGLAQDSWGRDKGLPGNSQSAKLTLCRLPRPIPTGWRKCMRLGCLQGEKPQLKATSLS